MITRFYVDNYKCLVNFEYKPKPFELIIGANGSGKTTVFEALDKVRQFVSGKVDAREVFRPYSGTRWISKRMQTFEVGFLHQGVEFTYRLELKLDSSEFRVEKEVVSSSSEIICDTGWREKKIKTTVRPTSDDSDDFDDSDPFDDHYGHIRVVKSGESEGYSMSDPNVSMNSIGWLGIEDVVSALTDSLVVRMNPFSMDSQVNKVTPRPKKDLSNFPSYYLYLLQKKQGLMFEMIPHLRESISGFDSFVVEEDFEAGRRELKVAFRSQKRSSITYDFTEISDGQRALIVLYTLAFCALDVNSTLIIDEPENYIALRELQPLIVLMEERAKETGGQILLISHNPEFINMLVDRRRCVRFYRENNGHTRLQEFNPTSELTAAEIVARGAEDDE